MRFWSEKAAEQQLEIDEQRFLWHLPIIQTLVFVGLLEKVLEERGRAA